MINKIKNNKVVLALVILGLVLILPVFCCGFCSICSMFDDKFTYNTNVNKPIEEVEPVKEETEPIEVAEKTPTIEPVKEAKKPEPPKIVKIKMLNPNDYLPGTPNRVFADYLNNWHRENWYGMYSKTQKTWSSRNSADKLKDMYDLKNLKGAKIIKTKIYGSGVAGDITAKIQYEFAGELNTKTIKAKVIKESKPLKTSTSGDWGVNPISTLREE